ncbi:WD repeat-containing protein C10orf79, partial [Gryllus bimaculatus]
MEKLPEEWNEEEIRLVRDYDQKVLNLMDQRRLYRKICGKEYEEILQNQKESMLKFDKRLQQLLLLKMEIQSCIDQENLKILRGRMKIHERMKLENQEHSILKEIENTDKEINELQAEIHNLLEAKRNCRHEYDSLLFRERNFDKSFKKEFRDYHGPIASHLYKLYKPKVHQKAQMSVSLLEELSRCTMQPGELPSYLPSDCLDFLNALEDLDQHSHVPHGASEAAWNSLCKLRRSKIECELKENLEELNRRVRRAKKSNFHLDKNIIDLNVDVNELMLKRDAEQDEEQDKCRRQSLIT